MALTGGRAFPETEEGELQPRPGTSQALCWGEAQDPSRGHPGLSTRRQLTPATEAGLPMGARTAAKQTALLGSPSLHVCLLTPDEGPH